MTDVDRKATPTRASVRTSSDYSRSAVTETLRLAGRIDSQIVRLCTY